MEYLIPIDKKTGKISPVELLDMFIANNGKLEIYPTHQECMEYDAKKGMVSKSTLIDYSFDTYREYVKLPDFTKIKPYSDVRYDVVKQEWLYDEFASIAKSQKLQELAEYDSSSAVNSFTIQGTELWLDKSTRLSLMNLAQARKNIGKTDMDIAISGNFITLPIDSVIYILQSIEVYAGDCYNVTQNHSSTISNLATIEDIETYDFKTNYPDKLNF